MFKFIFFLCYYVVIIYIIIIYFIMYYFVFYVLFNYLLLKLHNLLVQFNRQLTGVLNTQLLGRSIMSIMLTYIKFYNWQKSGQKKKNKNYLKLLGFCKNVNGWIWNVRSDINALDVWCQRIKKIQSLIWNICWYFCFFFSTLDMWPSPTTLCLWWICGDF